jgi:type IV secretion system protein VirB10
MAIAEKSIIDPDVPKPGIPIKKSTIGIIVGCLLGATVISSLVMQSATLTAQPQKTTQATKGASDETGSTASIEEERKNAADAEARTRGFANAAAAKAAQASATAGNTQQTPTFGANGRPAESSPIPDSLRRKDENAALYEKSMAAMGGVSGRVAPMDGLGAQDPKSLTEAESRRSKALAFDEGEDKEDKSSKLPTAASAIEQLLGFTPLSKAPSESLKTRIDANIAAIQAAQVGGVTVKTASSQRGWLNEYAQETGKRNEITTSYPTVSPYTLHQGKVIPAVLGRLVNSDLPGSITATTTVDVYDSLGKGNLLIPKGSSLIGRYDSDVKVGQERVLFAFQRLVMPNGQSFDLPAAQGSDLAGAAGAAGDVNNHFFKMFASSFLVAWAADRVQQPTSVTVNGGSGGTTTSPAGQVLVDVSRTILDRNKNLQPTITLPQGTRINVEVARDMEFIGPYARTQ